MNKCTKLITISLMNTLLLSGCTHQNTAESSNLISDTQDISTELTDNATAEEMTTEYLAKNITEYETETITTTEPSILHFVDVYGEEYEVAINPNVPQHSYDMNAFSRDEQFLSYESATYTSQIGIDVSHYQGNIDWAQVKESGIEFAFIRLGYRGYATGELCLDRYFFQNLENAQANGIDVGIYFFSQAISEEEAIEEANYVIQNLNGYDLELPVVYDPESILHDDARTDDISGEQFTKNTIAFCQTIKDAGFEPMIYSNMLWEAYNLDLAQLTDYPIWYADYELLPQTPYHFTFWQYSNTGSVNGIDAAVDLNIRFIPKQ